MTHYVVVQLTPKDPQALAQYRTQGGAAVRAHGGAHIAGGADTIVLEENGGGPPAAVLLSFPDAAAAQAWIDDPAFADVHALRRAGAATTITLLSPV